MKRIDIAEFQLAGAVLREDNSYFFPDSSARLHAEFAPGTFGGMRITPDQYLVMDVCNLSDASCTVSWRFFESDGSSCAVRMSIFAGVTTRLSLPFSIVQGHSLYVPRTPGRLKCIFEGHPIRPERMCRFALHTAGKPGGIVLRIDGVYVSDTEPDYPLEPKILMDELGQKATADWQGKTHGFAELCERLHAEAADRTERPLPNRSAYGGWTQKRFAPTGFFTVQHDGRRWWLADPDGYAFFSTGFDNMSMKSNPLLKGIEQLCESLPDKSDDCWVYEPWYDKDTPNALNFARYNVKRVFGEGYHDIWSAMMRRRMISWGMNTSACWSDPAYIEKSNMPFVIGGGRYPVTDKCIFRDFPDVFSPEFTEKAKEWARFLAPYAENKNLIGYFMANEPAWAFVNDLNIAAVMLASDEAFYSKDYAIAKLKGKYGMIDALNAAWGTQLADFQSLVLGVDTHGCKGIMEQDLWEISADMTREFMRVPSLAAREVDPNHLNLGIRYAWFSNPVLENGCEYVDVFSFNCYDMDPTPCIEKFAARINKPLLLGEFHFGALDRGLDAPGLRAVADQTERGVAYRYYVERVAAHPLCIGAHYFKLYDQPFLGRYDGENYQIGALDVCSRPYTEFIDAVTDTNRTVYEVADGRIPPTEQQATEICSLMR